MIAMSVFFSLVSPWKLFFSLNEMKAALQIESSAQSPPIQYFLLDIKPIQERIIVHDNQRTGDEFSVDR